MAVTVKARARGLLRGARDLLGERSLPEDVRAALEKVEGALKRTWADLESEAAPAEVTEAARAAEGERVVALREARNVGQWFEAMLHREFTVLADGQFGDGWLSREERIGLSSAIGAALDAFARKLSEVAPALYSRDPYEQAPGPVLIASADLAPIAESISIEGEIVPLMERAVRSDGTTAIKLIAPGWGTSGYYSAEVLGRDGPQVFRAGTHMYVDHPTATDEVERPERSLKELGAVLVSDAAYRDDPQAGPGLYADAKVFSSFSPVIEEAGPYIGVSINADGMVREGAAEGRSGRIVEQIRGARSVDFVTRAGAGGKVMPLYESLRRERGLEREGAKGVAQMDEAAGETGGGVGEDGMNEEEVRGLREAKEIAEQETARLREALLLREARDVAAGVLAEMELPEPTRKRLVEGLSRKPAIVENKLDAEAFKATVREAATKELEYLAEATGAGSIVGMGSTSDAAASPEALEKSLTAAFRGLGMSESLAERAAKGR